VAIGGGLHGGNWKFWMPQVLSSSAWIPGKPLYMEFRIHLVSLRGLAGPNKHDCSGRTRLRGILTAP